MIKNQVFTPTPSTQAMANQPAPRPIYALGLSAVLALALTGCNSNNPNRSGIFEPYRVDLSQGNYITDDAVKQIKVGMNPEQVRNIMGTALLLDPFRPNRWDYVFHYKQANGKTDTRRATVFFDQSKVTKVEATELPATEATDDPVLRRGRTAVQDNATSSAPPAPSGSSAAPIQTPGAVAPSTTTAPTPVPTPVPTPAPK
jgi:outer membrane protein assembly factor BamE